MMRLFLALPLAFAIVAAAPVDHSKTIVVTPEGGFRMGNPAAKVRLVEYASTTCSHCRAFHLQGHDALIKNYVASGRVSYEVRNLVLNGPDLAATTLARCQGPKSFFRTIDVLFRQQPQWTAPFMTIPDAETKRIGALPEDQQLAAIAVAGKLDQFAAANGMPRAVFDKCLADKAVGAQIDALIARAGKEGVQGTPTFFLNGKKLNVNVWGGVEPQLRAALAAR
jgi:protein-disulfide isomerase